MGYFSLSVTLTQSMLLLHGKYDLNEHIQDPIP